MFYTFICHECGSVHEIQQGMDEVDVVVGCENPECQMPMTRRENRLWGADPLTLHTNCTGGGGAMQWEGYFDPNIVEGGTWIESKEHRAELMKREGIREYTPDPEMQRIRDEQAYIQKEANPKDAGEANAAVAALQQTAGKIRRERISEPAFKRVAEKVKAEVLK